MDPENNVVKLCAEGMQAEVEQRYELARQLFEQAWDAHTSDYEACIAAHYLARQQDSPEEILRWNREALDRANAARLTNPGNGTEITGFMPSLYLNMGWSYEISGRLDEASRYYREAMDYLEILEIGPYRELVQSGVKNGLMRIATKAGESK